MKNEIKKRNKKVKKRYTKWYVRTVFFITDDFIALSGV